MKSSWRKRPRAARQRRTLERVARRAEDAPQPALPLGKGSGFHAARTCTRNDGNNTVMLRR
jgi:hypothetical protein